MAAVTRRANRTLVARAKLVGAYRRRHDLHTHERDTGPADDRITELEQQLPDHIIAEARRIAEAPEHNNQH